LLGSEKTAKSKVRLEVALGPQTRKLIQGYIMPLQHKLQQFSLTVADTHLKDPISEF
jgi:hypothetical protein